MITFPTESLCDFRQGGFQWPIAQDLNFCGICTTCDASEDSHARHQKKKMNELRHKSLFVPELFTGTLARPTAEDCLPGAPPTILMNSRCIVIRSRRPQA